MNAAQDEGATFTERFQRGGDDFASRGKYDGRIELDGRLREGTAGPFCPEFECKLLVPRVAGSCVHFHVPVQRHLDGDVGGSAKSVEAQLAARLDPRKAQTAKANDSGTKQGSSLLVGKLLRDGIDKVFRRNSILRVPAVHGITSEGGMVAKIFRPRAAEFAGAIGVMQPGNPHPCADGKPACARAELLNHADDLVSRNHGRFLRDELPFNHVQVGPAHAAVRDANQYFPIRGQWSGNVRKHQRIGLYRGGRLEEAGFQGKDTPHPLST